MSIFETDFAVTYTPSNFAGYDGQYSISSFIAEYKRQYVNKTQQYTTKHSISRNFVQRSSLFSTTYSQTRTKMLCFWLHPQATSNKLSKSSGGHPRQYGICSDTQLRYALERNGQVPGAPFCPRQEWFQ